ncbi:MAG: hypothetical protein L0287_14605, partial [Anaerolineae bacterium]|nr:hypothetical protein [Anaerolineae bacterium]
PQGIGEFLYAGGHNSGGEGIHWEQPFMKNEYMGPCYGFANDSLTFARYEPPTACTCSKSYPMKVTKSGGPHGMPDGWRVYMGTRDIDGRQYEITNVPGDPNSFTIDFDNTTIVPMSVETQYFKARFWSKSPRVTPDMDEIQPYVGDGAFESNLNGGECQAPYGIAGLFDTQGGRRNINCRVSATVYDDPTYIAKACQDTHKNYRIRAEGHGLPVGVPAAWPALLIWYDKGASASPLETGLYRVIKVNNANNLEIARIDGTAIDFGGGVTVTTGATITKQNNFGGFGIHWLLSGEFETPRYENVHSEAGPGREIAHDNTMATLYIQHIGPMRTPTWGPPEPVEIKGARFAEHTAHGRLGGFIVDTRTISSLQWVGDINFPDFSTHFGDDTKVGKMFRAHDGTSFISPTVWKIRGCMFLDNPAVVDVAVDFKGDLISTLTGENVSNRYGTAMIDTGAQGTATIAHGCYKVPSFVSVMTVGDLGFAHYKHVEVQAISDTLITVRVSNASGVDVTHSNSIRVMWEARV